MEKYTPKYKPADNAQIVKEAQAMSKSELEDYYVKDRNKRHTTCGGTVAGILLVLFFIFIVGAMGFTLAQDHYIKVVEENSHDVSYEVCPYLEEGFVSQELFPSKYYETRIICNQLNSNSLNENLPGNP